VRVSYDLYVKYYLALNTRMMLHKIGFYMMDKEEVKKVQMEHGYMLMISSEYMTR